MIDLQIERGKVEALVSGSEIYKVKVDIAVAAPARWKAICRDCAGSVGSLVELLQGKLSKNVMERVCREADGLFPAPREIKMSCSCPDWADMCKHVAATLYGVGARLDSDPDLLFTLRGVDRAELVSTVGADLPLTASPRRANACSPTTTSRRCSASTSPPMAPPWPAAPIRAAQAKSNAKPAQSAAPVKTKAKTKTKTKRQTAELSVELRADRKSPRPTPPAVTSGTRWSRKAKSISDKAPVERVSAKLKPREVVESGGAPRKHRGATSAPPARTRAAKWVDARARKIDA